MSEIGRRDFLKGAAAASVVVAVPFISLTDREPSDNVRVKHPEKPAFVGLAPGPTTDLKPVAQTVTWTAVTTTASAAIFYDKHRKYLEAIDIHGPVETANGDFTLDLGNTLNPDGTLRYDEEDSTP